MLTLKICLIYVFLDEVRKLGGCPDGEACFSNMEENNGVGDIVQETTCEGHFKVESPN